MQPHFAILLPLGLLPPPRIHFPLLLNLWRTAPGAGEGPCLSVNPLSFSPPRNRARPLPLSLTRSLLHDLAGVVRGTFIFPTSATYDTFTEDY